MINIAWISRIDYGSITIAENICYYNEQLRQFLLGMSELQMFSHVLVDQKILGSEAQAYEATGINDIDLPQWPWCLNSLK